VLRLLAVPLVLLAFGQSAREYESSIRPLPSAVRASLQPESWRPGCPVALSDLRLLTVTHWGWDGRVREGQLIVHEDAARPLATVFRRLYRLKFPIRHMRLDDMYGPKPARPGDGDVTGSFRCRQSVPSPCVGGSASGRWSNHAYGLAVDINPVENPYVGSWGVSPPNGAAYVDRTPKRKGMIKHRDAVWKAFRRIGWEWGGDWRWPVDYQHFSVNGR
jgi:D-alanyl-D-alanine carboxypeptidase